ncbi:GFA family protein [Tabrizicola sp. M-4]|uniref:GFA family protein n=1 Tax=Tabrizicola sp. M-4 TaxID=3055847 RepID=UPI003DA9FD72
MRGACHCGAVRFEVEGEIRDALACHCTQCRKVSGHYWAAASVPVARWRVTEGRGLRWYRSSPVAQRGFCGDCGAVLFWLPEADAVFDWGTPEEHAISFSPGALEGPVSIKVSQHIYTEDAGDYYAPEGAPPETREAPERLTASCLCGACRFTLPGPAGAITACHCHQCRSLSGHYSASFDAEEAEVDWLSRDGMAEYRTAGGGVRGFCSGCGSSLWFRDAEGNFSVEAGAVDGQTGGRLAAHIFVAEKGSHYEIDDGLPQFADRD